jgi:hypothetical protein
MGGLPDAPCRAGTQDLRVPGIDHHGQSSAANVGRPEPSPAAGPQTADQTSGRPIGTASASGTPPSAPSARAAAGAGSGSGPGSDGRPLPSRPLRRELPRGRPTAGSLPLAGECGCRCQKTGPRHRCRRQPSSSFALYRCVSKVCRTIGASASSRGSTACCRGETILLPPHASRQMGPDGHARCIRILRDSKRRPGQWSGKADSAARADPAPRSCGAGAALPGRRLDQGFDQAVLWLGQQVGQVSVEEPAQEGKKGRGKA